MTATAKISVTIGRDELAHAKRLASHLGLSLSGFITDAVRERVREQARREAAKEVVATFAPADRASPAEAQALLKLWGTAPAATKRESKSKSLAPRSRKAR
jgi:hypothetical protein